MANPGGGQGRLSPSDQRSPLAQRLVEEHLSTLVLLPKAGYLRDILALGRPLQLFLYFDQARLKPGYRLF